MGSFAIVLGRVIKRGFGALPRLEFWACGFAWGAVATSFDERWRWTSLAVTMSLWAYERMTCKSEEE